MLALGAAVTVLGGCGPSGPEEPKIPAAVPGPAASVTRAPGPGHQIALTVDDGFDPETVAAYVRLATDTGLALTFDPIGRLADTWQRHVKALRPLIEKGQVQIANHTFHHRLLTQCSDAQVRTEIERNEEWIEKTFRVTSRPYLRPPSGLRDARTDAIAGSLGFTRILMWQGSFEDAAPVSATQLMTNAREALLPGAVVVGHANVGTVTGLYPQLTALIRERGLQPVTLDQMFGTSRAVGA